LGWFLFLKYADPSGTAYSPLVEWADERTGEPSGEWYHFERRERPHLIFACVRNDRPAAATAVLSLRHSGLFNRVGACGAGRLFLWG
jgi:hypothetical protein